MEVLSCVAEICVINIDSMSEGHVMGEIEGERWGFE